MKLPVKLRKFTKDDPIPSDPRRVLSTEAETPAQIAKRTGLDLKRLCEVLIKWHQQGLITHLELRNPWCTLPLFRQRMVWDPTSTTTTTGETE